MRDWWLRAETKANVEHIRGLGWHGLRRKFATDLMQEAPLKVLSSLGGWKEPQTLLKCYQLPDESMMRQALSARERKRAVGDS